MKHSIAVILVVAVLSPSSTDYLTAQQQDSEPFSADGIPVVELPTEPVIYRTAEH